jgi:hypothetical protein
LPRKLECTLKKKRWWIYIVEHGWIMIDRVPLWQGAEWKKRMGGKRGTVEARGKGNLKGWKNKQVICP